MSLSFDKVPPPLFRALFELHEVLDKTKSPVSYNLLEMWNGFVAGIDEASRDCRYARKCEDLFLKHDYEGVKAAFLKAFQEFRKVEGEGFGRE